MQTVYFIIDLSSMKHLHKWTIFKPRLKLCFYKYSPFLKAVTYPGRLGARYTGLGAQKRFFNFLFFCCNSTKKYVEEVEMAQKTKNKQKTLN